MSFYILIFTFSIYYEATARIGLASRLAAARLGLATLLTGAVHLVALLFRFAHKRAHKVFRSGPNPTSTRCLAC